MKSSAIARAKQTILCALIAAAMWAPVHSWSAENRPTGFQSHQEIKQQVLQFLKELPQFPSPARIAPVQLDPQLKLPACKQMGTALATPTQALNGSVRLMVRCQSPSTWLIHLTVNVQTPQTYWVSPVPLAADTLLTPETLEARSGWPHELPSGTVTDPTLLQGKTLRAPLPEGRPLLLHMLKNVPSITAGQTIKVNILGAGYKITSDGRALNSANAGQSVQVRMANGHTILGQATPHGWVEVNP